MRQSTNYKWNLPEDEDEIDVEDLNAIFESADSTLKTHDNNMKGFVLPGSVKVISASGSGSFYHGTTSGFVSLLQEVSTTYGEATFGMYHGTISGTAGTRIQLYITLYVSDTGILCWDEHYDIYDSIDVNGHILTSVNIGTVSVGNAGQSTKWYVNYINDDAESDYNEEKKYSLREAINELALRIQILQTRGGAE